MDAWRLRRAPVVTIGYLVVVIGAWIWLRFQSHARRASALAWSSTSISNLEHSWWRALPASALWTQHVFFLWLFAIAGCVGFLELTRGPFATLGVAVAGHVTGTLLSEGVVLARVRSGDLPESARHLLDVGPSYIVMACGVAMALCRGADLRMRIAAGLLLVPLAAGTLEGLPTGEVDAIGHAVAALVGVGAAWWWTR